MPAIIRGQKISRVKLQRAKELREEMTEYEKILWNFLRRNGLHGFHFRRQQIIVGYIVDFYCHTANVVVEVDGEVHGMTNSAKNVFLWLDNLFQL